MCSKKQAKDAKANKIVDEFDSFNIEAATCKDSSDVGQYTSVFVASRSTSRFTRGPMSQ